MPYSDASTQSANTPSRSPLPRTSSTTDTPDIAHLAAEETLEQGKSESSIPSLHLDIGGESMLADDFSSNPMAENFWMLPIDMPADVDSDRTIGDPTFSDKDLKPAPEFITTEASAADTTLGNESEKSFADGTAAIPSNVISRVECDQPLVNAFEGFDANFFGLTPAELDQVFQNYQKELEDTTEAGILSAHVSEGLSTDAEIMHRLHDFDLDKTKVTPNESTTAQSNEKSFKTIINHNPDEMAEEDCPAKSKMEDRLDHFDLDKARYLPSNEDVDVETPCEDTALGTSSKNPIPVDLSETSFEMSGSTVDSDGDASDGASDNENPSESDSNAIIAFDQAVRSFHPLRNSLAPNKAGKAKTGKGLRTQENGAKGKSTVFKTNL